MNDMVACTHHFFHLKLSLKEERSPLDFRSLIIHILTVVSIVFPIVEKKTHGVILLGT